MNRTLTPLVLAVVVVCQVAAHAQSDRRSFIQENYTKSEHQIPMRDGVRLHTVIYQPRDTARVYPIILNRTPYSCRPYGEPMAGSIGPSPYLERDRYIFVKQDVRGRWMSEGQFDNMRPHVPGDSAIDESSDTYDTIEWLMANVQGHNGKVGITGISYPGFYAAAALPEAHPALVAVSPQAPIADFFFDDFHHQGAFILMYWTAIATFGYQHQGPTSQSWYESVRLDRQTRQDAYKFYLELGPLSNSSQYYGEDNFFWHQLVEHPNYDEYWQRRSILPHLKNIHSKVMTVGGWFDAEDLYGPLNIYREVEKNNPDTFNVLVMGPWSHGGWSRASSLNRVGNIVFGENISDFYQREVEAPFFRYFLKYDGKQPDFEALVFDTGQKVWATFDEWPPGEAKTTKIYLHAGGGLSSQRPGDDTAEYSEFISDPANPVPYRKRSDLRIQFTPRLYMTEDQRFASQRPDVLVFQSQIFDRDVTLAGDLTAHLKVSTTGTDSDWIVKLIDVYPDDTPNDPQTPDGIQLAGYQQMVRSEVIRGRFRNSFEHPQPFKAGEITEVRLPLQDVFHTFKAGHRAMIHVQSTWFPLVDRNPQKYVDNIFKAKAEDFIKATHRVYHSPQHPSLIEVKILQN